MRQSKCHQQSGIGNCFSLVLNEMTSLAYDEGFYLSINSSLGWYYYHRLHHVESLTASWEIQRLQGSVFSILLGSFFSSQVLRIYFPPVEFCGQLTSEISLHQKDSGGISAGSRIFHFISFHLDSCIISL